MNSKIFKSSIICAVFLISCSKLPFNIKYSSEDDYQPKIIDSVIEKAQKSGLVIDKLYFPNNHEYAISSKPIGHGIRLFNNDGYEYDIFLCHDHVPKKIINHIIDSKLDNASFTSRNFFTSDLPFLNLKNSKDSIASWIKEFEYLIVYYWDDYDYRYHGKFNFIESELVAMKDYIETVNMQERILLISVNTDNLQEYNLSNVEFFNKRMNHISEARNKNSTEEK